MDLRRIDFSQVPWEATLNATEAQESWQIFEDNIFQVQEWDTPILRKTSRCMRRPAWLIRYFMAELQCKKGSKLEVEAGIGYKEGIYAHCPGTQGWCLET